MSANIKITLPDSFNPDERAYFYQSLSVLNYFLLPGTDVYLIVKPGEGDRNKNNYHLEINFDKTTIKTSTQSDSYYVAIKKMMTNLQNKFEQILEVVEKSKSSDIEKSIDEIDLENDDNKIIH